MIIRNLWLFSLLIVMINTAHAQTKAGKWNVLVRQSFESTDTKSEPAALLVTFPYEKSFSYIVDGGTALERETQQSSQKIVAEYHRNTLIDKEQNNAQVGYSGEFYLRSLTNTIIKTNYILNGTAKYVRDVVASKGSFLHTLELGLFSNTFNTPIRTKGKNANYLLISPSIGYEYQNTFDAKTDTRDSLLGNILRGMGKIKISYTLNKRVKVAAPKLITKVVYEDSAGVLIPTKMPLFEIDSSQSVVLPAFQLYVSGAMRYDALNQTRTPDGWHPYLQTGVDYILTRNEALEPRLSIGISFVNGENPAQGLLHQKYWLLALKFAL